MSQPAGEPAPTLLHRTRLAVVAVLLGTALVAAAGRLIVAHAPVPPALPPPLNERTFPMALIGIFAASYTLRRGLCSRAALRDPATRSSRFFTAHVLAATVGAQAAVLGVFYRWLFGATERELAPYWVAAALCIALAFPRAYELDDLDEPGAAAP